MFCRSGGLCRPHLAFAIAFALSRNVVSEHGAEHEILFGREFVERFVDKCLHRVQAKPVAEVKVYLIIRNRLTHNMNISEIAYEVGFNDPKYFTRCFTKHFGTTPSSMMENGTD